MKIKNIIVFDRTSSTHFNCNYGPEIIKILLHFS